MARPTIGLFGALFAVGSVLAWKWMQTRDAASRRTARDLSRWEDEGGKVITPASAASRGRSPHAANGHAALGGTRDAWNFPRG
jgi:hypothetical protein